MYAIVRTGGKQYRVERGQRLLIERLAADEGADVALEPILYRSEDAVFDKAGLERVKVTAKVLAHVRGEKLRVFKFKPKRGYRRRTGHRQSLTEIEVTDIAVGRAKSTTGAKSATGAKPAAGRAKPVAARAKPAAARPKPAAARPKPEAARPKPAAARPKPEAARPKPAAARAKPAAARPKPAAGRAGPAAAKADEAERADASSEAPKAKRPAVPKTNRKANDGS
jgi:large subunit ribosomal protein L21